MGKLKLKCLCKNLITNKGVFATVNMICRPDGSVECVVGYHFGRDGTCRKSCTASGVTSQVGKVDDNCYCGAETNECKSGSYCIGAGDTTQPTATCVDEC